MIRALMLATALSVVPLSFTAQAVMAQTTVGADAPELAQRGSYPVGTRSLSLTFADRPDLLVDPVEGVVARADRIVPIEVWYPTVAAAAADQSTTYVIPTPQAGQIDRATLPATLDYPGKASRDAAPASEKFPLVILSHGYSNRAVMFSDLAEILASRGYVVVSIEHNDPEFSPTVSFGQSFRVVLGNRAIDQRLVIAELTRRAAEASDPLWSHVDASNVAVGGYSMGGYGALATAGAAYDPASPLYSGFPAGPLDDVTLGKAAAVPANLKAVIAFAPWGGEQPATAWSAEGLAGVTLPSLFIAGDQDDVSGYEDGIKRLFEGLTGSDRRLLVYRNARHNVAMNGTPPALQGRFEYLEKYEEPVWRKDRLLGINAHMIGAFLDLTLKGDTSRAAFLDVPTPVASDGTWPLAPGAQAGAAYATPTGDSATYWAGFQRRWAVGLELHHKTPSP